MTEVTGEIEAGADSPDYDPLFFEIVVEQAFQCDNCGRLNLHSLIRSEEGSGEWSPRHQERRKFPDVPEHIAEAASEATLCHSVGAHRAVGSLARAVIEATAKDRGAAGGNLAARIDALRLRDDLREHTKEQAHEIRHFGNDMAHGDFIDPVTEEEAAEVIALMSEVLSEVYQAPAQLQRVRAARLAKQQKG
jgi:hypothetical protein